MSRSKQTQKAALLAVLQIVLFAFLTLCLAALLILELLPKGTEGLSVKSPLAASSSSLSPYGEPVKVYRTQIIGSVTNSSEQVFEVSSVQVTVSNGYVEKNVEYTEAFTLPPRHDRDIVFDFEGDADYDRVIAVTAVVNGERVEIKNTAERFSVGGAAIFFGILLIPCVCLLIRACKVRYYIRQEERA